VPIAQSQPITNNNNVSNPFQNTDPVVLSTNNNNAASLPAANGVNEYNSNPLPQISTNNALEQIKATILAEVKKQMTELQNENNQLKSQSQQQSANYIAIAVVILLLAIVWKILF
jgi:aspartate oxidase